MNELSGWFEVLRSLLPQRYEMRIIWEREAIVISCPHTERALWLTPASLARRGPSEVVDTVRSALRGSSAPYVRVA